MVQDGGAGAAQPWGALQEGPHPRQSSLDTTSRTPTSLYLRASLLELSLKEALPAFCFFRCKFLAVRDAEGEECRKWCPCPHTLPPL